MVNGKNSSASSVSGSHLGSVAQQRQMNFWGAPLNVEHSGENIIGKSAAISSELDGLTEAAGRDESCPTSST